jgi:hypothetical protein
MKKSIILCALLLFSVAHPQDRTNVISYYAVGNSLDGQPMIDMMNLLRFYPVFAVRDNVDSVVVMLYYGSKTYQRAAKPFEGKKYWEVLLPTFTLGEAIQRIEVEERILLDVSHRNEYNHLLDILKDSLDSYKLSQDVKRRIAAMNKSEMKRIEELAKKIRDVAKDTLASVLKTLNDGFEEDSRKYTDWLARFGMEKDTLPFLAKAYISDRPAYQKMRDSLILRICDTTLALKSSAERDSIIKGMHKNKLSRLKPSAKDSVVKLLNDRALAWSNRDSVDNYLSNYISISEWYNQVLRNVSAQSQQVGSMERIARLRGKIIAPFEDEISNLKDAADSLKVEHWYGIQKDSLEERIKENIKQSLTDTTYSGPSVRKSDIIIDATFQYARVLYRNYKTSLRRMPALDPAERLGIFRVRYVPFPIVGTDEKSAMNLKRPFTSGSPTVFEVGLAFGNAIVPGDDFVVPSFSWERLGIAFAITERLFADSAVVLALALTYDFNSYGSIGIGGNFAGKSAHGYASFGINKKAFEAVIKGIAGIFK